MITNAQAFALKWKDAYNSHDIARILSLYSESVVFKSPRVRNLTGEASGTLHGKEAVRDYWRKLLELRPELTFTTGRLFAGADSIALEYRVGDLQGIEFMVLDKEGLVSFAAGNDLVD